VLGRLWFKLRLISGRDAIYRSDDSVSTPGDLDSLRPSPMASWYSQNFWFVWKNSWTTLYFNIYYEISPRQYAWVNRQSPSYLKNQILNVLYSLRIKCIIDACKGQNVLYENAILLTAVNRSILSVQIRVCFSVYNLSRAISSAELSCGPNDNKSQLNYVYD
jgi:hypothetical protein